MEGTNICIFKVDGVFSSAAYYPSFPCVFVPREAEKSYSFMFCVPSRAEAAKHGAITRHHSCKKAVWRQTGANHDNLNREAGGNLAGVTLVTFH